LIGTFVDVSIVLRRVKEAITVPRDAVVRQGPLTFVWVESRAGSEWKYQGRDVTVGAADDRYVEIAAGDLAPGVHTVVVRGAYPLTLIGGGGDPHAGHGHDHEH
jgi:multidrug efflux pump subunit AcrA (membrane-fusion protein)